LDLETESLQRELKQAKMNTEAARKRLSQVRVELKQLKKELVAVKTEYGQLDTAINYVPDVASHVNFSVVIFLSHKHNMQLICE
jgi:septal ring factor EnvC (AmiA/AmiB activator)